jgi:hypothetical protein
MLRKMSIGAMAALAVSMSSLAVAQDNMQMRSTDWQNVSTERHWSSANWNPMMAQDMNNRYPGDAGTVWSHAMMSLNAGQQFDLKAMLRRVAGSEEHVLMKGMAAALEKNATDYMTAWMRGDYSRNNMVAGSNQNPANTTGTANQPMTGSSMVGYYPREWELKPVGDIEAYDLLMGGLDESERGVVRRLWPELQQREQDAVLQLIKESPRVHARIMRYDVYSMDWRMRR